MEAVRKDIVCYHLTLSFRAKRRIYSFEYTKMRFFTTF